MDNPTRFYSSKQENLVTRYLDGNITPNSGAGKFKKGDILLSDTILECKTKTKESTQMTIKKEWIDNVWKESISMGKLYWGIVFDFGTQNINDQYVIMPISEYREYQELKEVISND